MRPGRSNAPRPNPALRSRKHPETRTDGRGSSPLREYDLFSCSLRFFASALFGLFIDIVIVCLAGVVVLMGFRPGWGWLLPVLSAVPVVWGALGIFFYDDMLDLAGEIVERFFLFWR